MSQNYYLYEKLAEAHRQDLLREAEQQRLLARLSEGQDKGVRHTIGIRGTLVLILALMIVAALVAHFIVSSGLA